MDSSPGVYWAIRRRFGGGVSVSWRWRAVERPRTPALGVGISYFGCNSVI